MIKHQSSSEQLSKQSKLKEAKDIMHERLYVVVVLHSKVHIEWVAASGSNHGEEVGGHQHEFHHLGISIAAWKSASCSYKKNQISGEEDDAYEESDDDEYD